MILYKPDSYFWFLWVLFWIYCIFTLCRWIADLLKVDELIAIGFAATVLTGMMVGMELRWFGFQFLAYYFLFYTLGYCIHRFVWLQIKDGLTLAVMVAIWGAMAWSWNMHELPSWMPAIPHVPPTLLQYIYRGLTAVVAVLALFGLAPKVLDTGSRQNVFIKGIGTISLGLYVVHLLIIKYIVELTQSLIHDIPMWGMIGIVFCITFIVSLIVVRLIGKNHRMASLLLGKG